MNPDVSLMSTGEWAIAVYQDTYNDYIMAELFKWDGAALLFYSISTIKVYKGGINVKIDGFWDSSTGERWMLVWNKDDQLAVFATAGFFDPILQVPVIDINRNVILQGNGTSIYSAPDVTILRNNVYFTYNEFDGTNNILKVEKQNWLVIKAGQITTPTNYVLNYSNTDYAYDLPRISSFFDTYYNYDNWAVVAQTMNAATGGTEIHGFATSWNHPLNSSPYVYNDGSLASPFNNNDITIYQNSYPVISYVGDYIFILWQVDPIGYAVSVPDQQDIIGIRMNMDGQTFSYQSEYYFVVNRSTKKNQLAPSISGRRSLQFSNFLAAFYNDDTGAPGGQDVYFKQNIYSASFNTLFRVAATENQSPSEVSPNPFNDKVVLNLEGSELDIYSISIIDGKGKVIEKIENVQKKEYIWSPSKEMASGLYLLQITNTTTGKTQTQKINKL